MEHLVKLFHAICKLDPRKLTIQRDPTAPNEYAGWPMLYDGTAYDYRTIAMRRAIRENPDIVLDIFKDHNISEQEFYDYMWNSYGPYHH